MLNVDLTNTVDANNQLKSKTYIRFGKNNGSPKILFAGNSMSWHAPKKDIGWSGDWGMAASCEEKDYVHQIMNLVRKKYPDASYCIAQCSFWESNLENDNIYDKYIDAARYNADIIVMVLGENIAEQNQTKSNITKKFNELISYLKNNRDNVPVLISKPFLWEKPIVSQAIDDLARCNDLIVMDMSSLKDDLSFRAIGRFEHSGVASHPGDKGMEKIAEIIFNTAVDAGLL